MGLKCGWKKLKGVVVENRVVVDENKEMKGKVKVEDFGVENLDEMEKIDCKDDEKIVGK